MGMTIDDAIPIIHDMYNYYSDEMVEPYVGFDADDKQAIETALDTMRKYQKIQEIVENRNSKPPLVTLNRIIREVELISAEQEPTTKNDKVNCDNTDCNNCVNHKYCDYEPTTKNDCETCVHNKGILECDMYGCKYESTTKNDLGVDSISRAQAQTELEMNALRYTIAKERGGIGQVEWSDQLIKVSDAVDIIRDLPSTTPQEPRWISVSERLPTKEEYIANNGLFIVSDGNRTYAEYFDVYNSMKYFGEPTMNGFRVDRCVIAWMPLPKPYEP